MKENSKKDLNYLKEINGENVTAADVAAALGLEKRSVDGIFTSGIQRKGLGVRTPAEIELEDGTHKQVKFLSLTPAGMAFDPAFYYYRPVNVAAAHGYGPVIWAGAEMINLLKKQYPKMNDSAVQFYSTEQKTNSPIFHEKR